MTFLRVIQTNLSLSKIGNHRTIKVQIGKPMSLFGILTRQEWLNDLCIIESVPHNGWPHMKAGPLRLYAGLASSWTGHSLLSLSINTYLYIALERVGACESCKPQKPFETCELFTSWIVMDGLQYGNISAWWTLLQNKNKLMDETEWIISIIINWKECKKLKMNKISISQISKEKI